MTEIKTWTSPTTKRSFKYPVMEIREEDYSKFASPIAGCRAQLHIIPTEGCGDFKCEQCVYWTSPFATIDSISLQEFLEFYNEQHSAHPTKKGEVDGPVVESSPSSSSPSDITESEEDSEWESESEGEGEGNDEQEDEKENDKKHELLYEEIALTPTEALVRITHQPYIGREFSVYGNRFRSLFSAGGTDVTYDIDTGEIIFFVRGIYSSSDNNVLHIPTKKYYQFAFDVYMYNKTEGGYKECSSIPNGLTWSEDATEIDKAKMIEAFEQIKKRIKK